MSALENFGTLMFTPAVLDEQRAQGSYDACARIAARPAPEGLGEQEISFLTTRSSFYMSTVSETGWPYIQHRGGPAGFVKVLDPQTIAFADYSGNQQFISKGNLSGDNRVSLFFMDYARKARLKLVGHARMVNANEARNLSTVAADIDEGRAERVVAIKVAAFDWNCPQYIERRFDTNELAALVAPEISRLEARIKDLEADLDRAQYTK